MKESHTFEIPPYINLMFINTHIWFVTVRNKLFISLSICWMSLLSRRLRKVHKDLIFSLKHLQCFKIWSQSCEHIAWKPNEFIIAKIPWWKNITITMRTVCVTYNSWSNEAFIKAPNWMIFKWPWRKALENWHIVLWDHCDQWEITVINELMICDLQTC